MDNLGQCYCNGQFWAKLLQWTIWGIAVAMDNLGQSYCNEQFFGKAAAMENLGQSCSNGHFGANLLHSLVGVGRINIINLAEFRFHKIRGALKQ